MTLPPLSSFPPQMWEYGLFGLSGVTTFSFWLGLGHVDPPYRQLFLQESKK